MATVSSRRTMPTQQPLSTVARALEAEESLEAENQQDSPNTSTDSPQPSTSDSHGGSASPGLDSDPGLSTIEERTEASERAWTRPLSQVSTGAVATGHARYGNVASAPLAEETEGESTYGTVADTSGASSTRPSHENTASRKTSQDIPK